MSTPGSQAAPLEQALQLVGEDQALQEALATLGQSGREPLTLVCPAGVRAAVAAAAWKKKRAKGDNSAVVVVTATGREAEQLAHSIQAWGVKADYFPNWETLPHERLSPQLDTMSRRMAVLRRLTHAGEAQTDPIGVLVVPVRAFLQPIIKGAGDVQPLTMRVGDWIDRDKIVSDLVQLGYEPVEMVERRGQVAVHGGIIDIFVPINPHPLRVELFGDEVDEIRWFNLSDQRSMGEAEEGVWAPATRELLLTPKVRERALKLQRQFPAIADILELASEGIYAPGIESLAAVLGDGMTSLISLLPSGTLLCVDELQKVLRRSEDLVTTSNEFLEASWGAAAEGAPVPVDVKDAAFVQFSSVWAADPQFSWWQMTELPSAALADHGDGSVQDDLGDFGEDEAAVAKVVGDDYQVGARSVHPYQGDFTQAATDLAKLNREGWKLVVTVPAEGAGRRLGQILSAADVPTRLQAQLEQLDAAVVHLVIAQAGQGFVMPQLKMAVLTETDLIGGKKRTSTREMRKMPSRRRKGIDPLTLQPGDFVVHEQHGVGRFLEMVSRTTGTGVEEVKRDYLVLEYAPSKRGQPADVLYVPTSSLDMVSKYSGSDQPRLSKMGGADWAKTKHKAQKAVQEIAAELVRLYAARQATPGFAFSPDTPWQRELEDSFPYVETPDQLVTIDEVKADMEREIPMDRLLTGDVGYGKTEVAVRAAFKAIQDSKQVAVLVPTTLLVQQHYDTFMERYAGFPVKVAQLSRFASAKESERVRAGLRDGSIDLVIGTHSLITGAVRFKDLGLVIVDEEQRFGVEHKETLKALRTNVDVLSMSATPIPRTLEMAIAGIREMSVLQTPPEERQPVLTYVGAYQNAQVAAAVRRELLRDGQVFFVHNRVESINETAAKLQELIPEARIRVAHGKLHEHQLEKVIVDFWNHEFDVLVCTTIIETGLDISNANTLIVDRADAFGLSQLHQLRGRVGRGRERAYAYFFYPSGKTLTETALERLRTIAANTDLGSGLAVAQKDLEIRGAGNLLGGAQSGHIEGVGFDLYVRMVADAVAQYKGDKPQETTEVRIDIAVDAYLPDEYVPSEKGRLEVYAKIAAVNTPKMAREVREELTDRYGKLPKQVERLFLLARLRSMLRQLGITEVITQGKYLRFSPVELADSQALRLKRLYPGSVIKSATRQVLVPTKSARRVDAPELHDEELVKWIENLIKTIFVMGRKAK